MLLGARIRALRNERNLTLGDIAGETLSVGLLSKLERGLVRPSLETLEHVAARLGVPPGSLLVTDAELAATRARGALAAARAHLLLGDPAAAGRLARDAQATDGAAAAVRARLLAVGAEAALVAGEAAPAALLVRDASALIAAEGAGADRTCAQLETAWVLGALERRRGALDGAERTWGQCLGALEVPPDVHPWWQYLRASVLSELGGLAEARADRERARNLIARAASIATGLAHASAHAAALLGAWSSAESAADMESREPPLPHAALTLALVAAAERLGRRLTLEAARLERAVWAPESHALAPDAPASRGLRQA